MSLSETQFPLKFRFDDQFADRKTLRGYADKARKWELIQAVWRRTIIQNMSGPKKICLSRQVPRVIKEELAVAGWILKLFFPCKRRINHSHVEFLCDEGTQRRYAARIVSDCGARNTGAENLASHMYDTKLASVVSNQKQERQ